MKWRRVAARLNSAQSLVCVAKERRLIFTISSYKFISFSMKLENIRVINCQSFLDFFVICERTVEYTESS